MSEQPAAPPALDLFSFLYEIWRDKVVFILVFILVASLYLVQGPIKGAVSAIIGNGDDTESQRNYQEHEFYQLQLTGLDPFQRSGEELVRDLITGLYPAYGLIETNDSSLARLFPFSNQETLFFENNDLTMAMALDVPEGGKERGAVMMQVIQPKASAHAEGLYDQLQQATLDQRARAMARIDYERAGIHKALQEVALSNGSTEALNTWAADAANLIQRAEARKAELEDLGDAATLINVLPRTGFVPVPPISGSSLVKQLVIATLLGLIAATLTIMFRVSIRREADLTS